MSDRMVTLVADCLDKAATWLTDNPDKHITGTLATSVDGHRIHYNDPAATYFCAVGRAYRECDDAGIEHVSDYLRASRCYAIAAHNDTIGKEYGIKSLRNLASDMRNRNR